MSINLLDGFEGKRGFVQRNNSLSRSVWCSRRPELLLWCFGKAWDGGRAQQRQELGDGTVGAVVSLGHCCSCLCVAHAAVAMISKAPCVPAWRGSI